MFTKITDINDFEEKEASYGRSFIISSLMGTGFGLLFMLGILVIKGADNLFVYLLPIISGIMSGVAGVMGNFIDGFLFQKGIKNSIIRKLISFIVVLFFTIITTLTAISLLEPNFTIFSLVQSNIIWGLLLGCIFGLIVMIVDYVFWKVKKKMLTLELENKYLGEIAEKEELLEETTKNLLISQERNRMARELHDSISQGIHGIIYTTKSIRHHLKQDNMDRKKALEVADHLEKTAEVTLSELRSMILELKPNLLKEKGLKQALNLLCNLFEKRQQIDVNSEINTISGINPGQEVAIYRIVQEALTNIQKYSGADLVNVQLKKESALHITLLVKDNGQGFDLESIEDENSGNGLKNMKIRSQKNGGQFSLETNPNKGTKIEVKFAIT